MCFVIVTCRSLLWTLLSLVATLVIVAAVITPQWLVGPSRRYDNRPAAATGNKIADGDGDQKAKYAGLTTKSIYSRAKSEDSGFYRPTLGIYNRCTRLHMFGHLSRTNCAPFVTRVDMPDDEFPHVWKAVLVLFMVAGALLTFTVATAIMSLCFRSLCGKDIFTLTGLIQSIAGLLMILGLVLYPAGWGSTRVQNLCGIEAGAFLIENCSLGWAFYACIGGTVLVFLCALLSIQAAAATSSQKVEEEIMQGRNPVCVL